MADVDAIEDVDNILINYIMPRRVGRPRKRRYGRGDPVADFNKRKSGKVPMGAKPKKNLWDEVKKAHGIIREHKLISRGAKLINRFVPNETLGEFGDFADQLGYGRRRRYKRRKR